MFIVCFPGHFSLSYIFARSRRVDEQYTDGEYGRLEYTLQKLFSAQSQNVQPPSPAAHQAAQFTHSQSRPHPAAASPTLKNASLTRGPSLPRTTNTNPFAAMGHTKPAAGAGLFKFMCTGAGAAPAHTSIGHVDGVTMDGIGETAVCEDCDRRMELAGFGGYEEGRCVGCTRRVCEVGCSIERGDGGRACLDCAMKGY